MRSKQHLDRCGVASFVVFVHGDQCVPFGIGFEQLDFPAQCSCIQRIAGFDLLKLTQTVLESRVQRTIPGALAQLLVTMVPAILELDKDAVRCLPDCLHAPQGFLHLEAVDQLIERVNPSRKNGNPSPDLAQLDHAVDLLLSLCCRILVSTSDAGDAFLRD